MPSSKINQLFNKLEPRIATAFKNAIKDLNAGVDMARLKSAIRRRAINDALAALNLSPAAFNELQDAITRVYNEGGQAASSGLKGARNPEGFQAVIRFDVRDQLSEAIIRNHSSGLISGITEDLRAGIRLVLEDGLITGRNPISVARDIVGFSTKTGARTGGALGLTAKQTERTLEAARELRSANPKKFLDRALADKRFKRTIEKAYRDGVPIPEDKIAKILAKYKQDLIVSRAETIARTEAMAALHSGQQEMYEQALRDGLISAEEIEREWSASGDNRVRESHREMDGQIRAWGEPFDTPDGAQLMFPGDPNGPADEVINCRCYEIIRVNYLARIGR